MVGLDWRMWFGPEHNMNFHCQSKDNGIPHTRKMAGVYRVDVYPTM